MSASAAPGPEGRDPTLERRNAAERAKIRGRAAIVAAGTLFSRLLGLGRDLVLAAAFPRAMTDAFLLAFQIPNLLRQLLAEGAVQNAVLPVLSQLREREGEDAAKRYFRSIRGLSLLVLGGVTLLGILFARPLVLAFTERFDARPEQLERTVELTRWVFPYIFFMGTTALGVAALNTHKRFTATSFAPALLNVAFIGCALGLPALLVAGGREPIFSMAIGALLGGLLQMLAQWPSLAKIGYLERPSFSFGNPAIGETLRRMGPTLIGIGVYYVDVIVGRRLLSGLGDGPVSYFGFAMRLCDFPQGIFVMALQTATLPNLASLAARGDEEELGRTFSLSMRLALFVGIPATVLFSVLAEPIVVVLFQRGHFDAEAARETAHALVAQSLGVFVVAGVRQLVAVFFALGDTKTPVKVAAMDLLVFVAVAYALRAPLGHFGVGLAVSLASLAQFSLLYYYLAKRSVPLFSKETIGSALRTTGATGIAGLATAAALSLLARPSDASKGAVWLALVVGLTIFGSVFLAAAKLLRSEELRDLSEPILRRLGR